MNDLIYNQKEIPKGKWRYGFRSSAATGCGWIATYNALRLLGYRSAPEDLIRWYERVLPLIHGNAGTTILAPALFFRQQGFPVRIVAKREKFDQAAKDSDVTILFYYWRSKWKFGAHFVTIRHKDGAFVGYNTFSNSTGPDNWGESIPAFMQRHKFFGAVLICIDEKTENEP